MKILLLHHINHCNLPISTYLWPPDEIVFILMDGCSINICQIYLYSSRAQVFWDGSEVGPKLHRAYRKFSTYLGLLVWSVGTLVIFPYSVLTNTWYRYCSTQHIWILYLIYSNLIVIVPSPYLHHIWNGLVICMTTSCGNEIVQIIQFQYPCHHQ